VGQPSPTWEVHARTGPRVDGGDDPVLETLRITRNAVNDVSGCVRRSAVGTEAVSG